MAGCTCGAWASIIPPGPCPWHSPQAFASAALTPRCGGRHCKHDGDCMPRAGWSRLGGTYWISEAARD